MKTEVDKTLQQIYKLSFTPVLHYAMPMWDTVLIAKNSKKLAKLHKKLYKELHKELNESSS